MKEIELSRGLKTIVDDDVYEWASKFKWSATSGKKGFPYAFRYPQENGKRILKLLHREILSAKKGEFVDHTNGNTLDNRRENIRLCTRNQNMQNQKHVRGSKSGYRGVYETEYGTWRAKIWKDGRSRYIGTYDTPEQAFEAYEKKAKEMFGKFYRT